MTNSAKSASNKKEKHPVYQGVFLCLPAGNRAHPLHVVGTGKRINGTVLQQTPQQNFPAGPAVAVRLVVGKVDLPVPA